MESKILSIEGDWLGTYGRIAILVVAAIVILVSFVIVACVVIEGCWLNRCYEDRKKKRKGKWKGELTTLFQSDEKFTTYETAVANKNGLPHKNSSCSSSSEASVVNCRLSLDQSWQAYNANGSLVSLIRRNSQTTSEYEQIGQIKFTLLYVSTNEERGTGKLIINVLDANGLQSRHQMGSSLNPYVKVAVWKERSSFRKSKQETLLQEFQSRTIRHASDPSFNEIFIIEVSRNELKDLAVRFTIMNSDKWVSPSTIGEVVQRLADIKNLAMATEKTTMNYCLAPAHVNFGFIYFGLNYLPTAQRLSVSLIKASNLKFSNVVSDLSEFRPYVKILLISSSRKVLNKKKSSFQCNTVNPVWNETLIFDMPPNLIENVTFILGVCTRPVQTLTSAHNTDSECKANLKKSFSFSGLHTVREQQRVGSERKQDLFVGKVVLGREVFGEREKEHWCHVLQHPRKVISHWHSLK